MTIKEIENQRFEEIKEGIPSFISCLDALGKHFNHTNITTGNKSNINVEEGTTNIKIANNATAKDVLELLKGYSKEDVSRYGVRLQDIGILLLREKVVSESSKAKEFALLVYNTGASICHKNSITDISKLKLSNESQEYKEELFLWAIGKGTRNNKYEETKYANKIYPVDDEKLSIAEEKYRNKRDLFVLRNKGIF